MVDRTLKIVGDTPVTKNLQKAAEEAARLDINIKNLQKSIVTFNKDGDRTGAVLKVMKDNLNTVNITMKKVRDKSVTRWKAINIAIESNIQKIRAQIAATREAGKAAAEAARARDFIAKQADVAQATPKQLVQFRGAVAAVEDFVNKNRIALSKVKKLWAELSRGEINQYSGKLSELQRRLFAIQAATGKWGETTKTTTERAKKNVKSLTLSWRTMGRIILAQLVRRALTAFLGSLRESIDLARQFEIRISEIRTIAQDNQLAFEQWAEGIFNLSNAFGFDVLDQAEAAYQALSNQVVKGAETFDFLAEANKFAIVTTASSTDAVNLLSSAIKSFGLSTDDTEQVAATLFKTIELGRVRASEMANTFGDVAILASQLNVTLEELTGTISAITVRGVKYNKVATQLRGIFIKLLKPTKEMKTFFEELGVATGEEAIEVFGLLGFLEKLSERTGGVSTEIAKLINRIRGISGALALTGGGLKVFEANLKANLDALDSYRNAIKIGFESSGRTITVEMNKVKNFFIKEFGQTVLENLVKIIAGMGGTDVALRTLAKSVKFILVPAIILLGNVLATLLLTNPLLIIAAGITLAALAINAALNEVAHRQEQFDIENNKRIAARVKAERQAINATFKIIRDSIKARLQLAFRLNAALIAIENKRINTSVEVLETLRKENKKSNDIFVKDARKNLKELEDTVKDANKLIKELFEETRKSFKEQEKIEFEFRLKGLQPKEIINQLANEIKRLGDLSVDLFDLDEADRAREALEDRVKLQDEIIKIATKAADKRKKLAEELIKLEKKQLEDSIKAEEKIRKAKKPEDISKAQLELTKLTIEQADELEKIITEQVILEDVESNINKLIKDRRILLEQNAAVRKQISEKAAATAKAATIEKLRQAELLDELLEVNKAIRAFDLEEALAAKTVEEVTDSLGEQADLLRRQNVLRKDITGSAEDNKKILEEVVNLNKLSIALEDRLTLRDRKLVLDEIVKARLEEVRAQEAALKASTATFIQAKERIKLEKESLDALVKREAGLLTTLTIQERQKFKADEFLKLIKEAAFLSGTILDVKDPKIFTAQASRLREIFKEIAKSPVRKEGLFKDALPVAAVSTILANVKQLQIEFDVLEKRKSAENLAKQLSAVTIELLKAERATQRTQKGMDNVSKEALTTASSINEVSAAILRFSLEAVAALKREGAALGGIKLPGIVQPADVIGKAKGGMIRSMGQDSVPALLSPGEFVVNSRASRRFFSQLVSMNSGSNVVPGFAKGGQVTNVGDVNITLQSTGSETIDTMKIAKGLKRVIRQGRIKL